MHKSNQKFNFENITKRNTRQKKLPYLLIKKDFQNKATMK